MSQEEVCLQGNNCSAAVAFQIDHIEVKEPEFCDVSSFILFRGKIQIEGGRVKKLNDHVTMSTSWQG